MSLGGTLGSARTLGIAVAACAAAAAIADLVRPNPAWGMGFVATTVLAIAALLAAGTRTGHAVIEPVSDSAAPAGAVGEGRDIASISRLRLLRQGLRMGLTAFGGAMAVVAQVERELVQRLRWVSPRAFDEAAAFGQSLPGAIAPNAMALLGFRMAGWPGAVLLVGGYVLPSFLLMLVFALLYDSVRGFRVVDGALAGLAPAVVAVVAGVSTTLLLRLVAREGGLPAAGALWRSRWRLAVAAAALVAVGGLGLGSPEVILGCGVLSLAWSLAGARMAAFAPVALATLPLAPHDSRLEAFGRVLGVFLSTGATTFGGGYVMVPVLERELVRTGWISAREFVDAVALGQVTPGPVVITATFVGYRLAGLAGALFGTLAVFGPGFVLAMALAASMSRVREHPAMRAFLAGLQPAIVGVMWAAVITLGRSGLHGWVGIALALVAFALILSRRVAVGPVLIGGAMLGIAARLAGVTL